MLLLPILTHVLYDSMLEIVSLFLQWSLKYLYYHGTLLWVYLVSWRCWLPYCSLWLGWWLFVDVSYIYNIYSWRSTHWIVPTLHRPVTTIYSSLVMAILNGFSALNSSTSPSCRFSQIYHVAYDFSTSLLHGVTQNNIMVTLLCFVNIDLQMPF